MLCGLNLRTETWKRLSDGTLTKVKLKTNRRKAIIFQNIFSLLQFGYMLTFKSKVLSTGVNSIDFLLVRSFVFTIMAFVAMKCFGKQIWPEELKDNKPN